MNKKGILKNTQKRNPGPKKTVRFADEVDHPKNEEYTEINIGPTYTYKTLVTVIPESDQSEDYSNGKDRNSWPIPSDFLAPSQSIRSTLRYILQIFSVTQIVINILLLLMYLMINLNSTKKLSNIFLAYTILVLTDVVIVHIIVIYRLKGMSKSMYIKYLTYALFYKVPLGILSLFICAEMFIKAFSFT